jgi:hypothetical protein
MERFGMEAGDKTAADHGGIDADGVSTKELRRTADPLYVRFAIPRDWRVKDMGAGG